MKEHFIKRKQTVLEENKSKTFCKGDSREDFADMWSNTGMLLLIGLPGSQREELGQELAARLALSVCRVSSMEELEHVCSKEKGIVVVANTILNDAENLSFVHAAGKVFYLMADVQTLVDRRMAQEDGLERNGMLERCAAQLALMEPLFMKALHFIIQPVGDVHKMADDAMEKVAW